MHTSNQDVQGLNKSATRFVEPENVSRTDTEQLPSADHQRRTSSNSQGAA
jgi:hypothetical protein